MSSWAKKTVLAAAALAEEAPAPAPGAVPWTKRYGSGVLWGCGGAGMILLRPCLLFPSDAAD